MAEPAIRLAPDLTPTAETPRDAGRPASPAADLPPLLVAAPEAARLCGVSEASWYRLKSAGKLPAPVKLGGRVLWRLDELRRWCAAGCPDLRTWQAMEGAGGRPSGHRAANGRA